MSSRRSIKPDRVCGAPLRRPTLTGLCRRLHALRNPRKARILSGFFKTGPGEYGEGDRFLGIPVPGLRRVAREFEALPADAAVRLLHSAWHEERVLGLLLLVRRFECGGRRERARVYRLYLRNRAGINNWDLVDLSAPAIVGGYLWEHDAGPLFEFAEAQDLWTRRIAIVATLHFIRQGEFGLTLDVARMLLGDREDLLHKATGWMLREVGKRDPDALREFLDAHAAVMPRTMLRYAIERFPERVRRGYLARRSTTAPSPRRSGRRPARG